MRYKETQELTYVSTQSYYEGLSDEDKLIRTYGYMFIDIFTDGGFWLYEKDDIDWFFLDEMNFGLLTCYNVFKEGRTYNPNGCTEPFFADAGDAYFGWITDRKYTRGYKRTLVSISEYLVLDYIKEELYYRLNNDLTPFWDWIDEQGFGIPKFAIIEGLGWIEDEMSWSK